METMFIWMAWAVFGAAAYKAASSIINLGRYSMFAQKVIVHSLTLLGAVVEDLAFIRELKYLQMVKSGMSEEQLEFVKKVDDQTLDSWKENSIRVFKSSFPGSLESIVKFNNWEEAMRELNTIHKKGGKS